MGKGIEGWEESPLTDVNLTECFGKYGVLGRSVMMTDPDLCKQLEIAYRLTQQAVMEMAHAVDSPDWFTSPERARAQYRLWRERGFQAMRNFNEFADTFGKD